MRLLCFVRQHMLSHRVIQGEALPPESHIAHHLARCPECRQVWAELRRLDCGLTDSLSAPTPAPGFESLVRLRVLTAAHGKRDRHESFLLASGTALLLVFLAWQFAPHRSGETQGSHLSASPESSAHSAKEIGFVRPPSETTIKRIGLPQPSLPVSQIATHYPRKERRSRRRRFRNRLHFYQPDVRLVKTERLASQPMASAFAPSPEIMCRLGSYSEESGDFLTAAAAFETAYAERPDPTIGLKAGEDAERSGDPASALNVLAAVLSSVTPQPSHVSQGE